MNLNEVISNQEVNVDASNEGAYRSFDSAPVSRDRPYSSSEISAREVTCVRNQMAYYLPNRPQILPARAAVVLMRRLGGCNVPVVEPAFLAEHEVFRRLNPRAESWPSPPDQKQDEHND